MKIVFVFTALAVCFLLLITLNATREETQPVPDKPDFYFEDFVHDASVAGNWNGKDYVIKMKIKTLKLDFKLVFNEKRGSTQHDGYYSPNGEQNDELQTCVNPQIVPRPKIFNNQTCQPRPPTLMTRAWNKVHKNTVAMTAWAWRTILNMMETIAGKVCNGVLLVTEQIWDNVMWMARWTWENVTRMAQWSWDRTTWLAEWGWYQVTWLACGMWDIVAWTVHFCITLINCIIDVFSELYAVYLKSHVTDIKVHIANMTRQDIRRAMIGICLVVSSLMSVYLMIRCVIRRRRQARLDKEAAAHKKPIWRPKPKKKRRKNKNDW